jgi:hypothetical protein
MAKKRATRKQSASNGTSKAQAIRDTAKELGKKARPKDIIAALAAKKITVSSPQVSSTLKAAGLRRGRRKKKAGAATVGKKVATNGRSHTLSIADLFQVRELVNKLGGADKLKDAVAVLERLR